jgi:hypothetical protein
LKPNEVAGIYTVQDCRKRNKVSRK